MNNPINPVAGLIAVKHAEIREAERALEKLRIELAALEQAHAAVSDLTMGSRLLHGQKSRKGRSLSERWKRVLLTLRPYGEAGATSDEIAGVCAAEGIKIERHTLRSQMTNYVKRGYLERPRDGVFRLTSEGARAAGVQSWTGVENAPPEPGRAF